MQADLRDVLESAKQARSIVRYRRDGLDAEDELSYGCLLDFSDEWILTSYISDRLDLDGYDAVRVRDLTGLDAAFERQDFLKRCLELKGLEPEPPRGVRLHDTKALLESVDRNYPLIVVQRERLAPDECELGSLKMIGDESYAVRWMTTEAEWADDERIYRFDDVTRVSFGGEYETTLAAVAGLCGWPVRP